MIAHYVLRSAAVIPKLWLQVGQINITQYKNLQDYKSTDMQAAQWDCIWVVHEVQLSLVC